MIRKFSILMCMTIAVLVANSELAVDVKVPRISDFLNRITNTTFDIIRGGANILGRAVDRVINTFGRIDDRLRALLEIFRKQLIKGIPELNIPVLDPLHINKIEFDVNHDSAKLKGNAEDVTIKYISKFIVDKEKFTDLGNLRFKLDLNLTFPYIKVNGTYLINGSVGQTFMIHGKGPFRINLINLKIGTTSTLKFNLPARLKLEKINVEVKLKKLENNFENLMNDKETGELFNKAISEMAPEALDILWPEIKPSVEAQITKYINNILENATVVNLAKRLFNIT